MRTFVFAAFERDNGIFQEIVEAADELEATRIFISEQGYMSYYETGRYAYADLILDAVFDEQEIYTTYIELE